MQPEPQETYLSHRLGKDRPHVLSVDCWCKPHVLSYGEEPVYTATGEIDGYTTGDDEDG